MVHIELSIKDIYKVLCPECQGRLRDLVKDRMAKQALDHALGGASAEEGGDAERVPGTES